MWVLEPIGTPFTGDLPNISLFPWDKEKDLFIVWESIFNHDKSETFVTGRPSIF